MSVTTDIFFKRAKFTSWSNNYKHVILPYGEPAIVKFDDNSMALKIGDGSSEFSSLNYIANSNVKLNIDYENNKILSFINLETNEELSLSLDTVQLKDLIVNGVGRFIGKVYASEFIGKLTGNADTATTATDADKLDGHHGSVAQSASTYVLRDSNGYINTSYINSNTPLNENPSISQVIVTNGNDHYYRKASLAHLKSSLGSMPANGGNSLTVNGHTVNSDVPANAKFTDTNTWRGIQNNLTSDSTTDSLSAAQGKVLKGLVDGKASSSHTHNYLPLSGGTMGGSIKFQASSLPQKDLEFICGIDAFINGGEMGWQLKDDFLSNCSKVNHTHNYAGSNSTGGNALTLQLDRVGNDANWLPSSPSTTQMRELSSSSYNIPYSQWWQILANRSADISYGSQLAMGMTTNDLYFRNYQSGNWGSWRKVIFSDDTISMANYATSAGNADTLDGNHASAFASSSHTHNYAELECNTIGEYHSVTSNIQVKSTSTTYEVARLNISNVFSDSAKTGTYLINLEMYLNADSQPQFSYNIDGKYSNFLCTISDIGTGNSLNHRRVTFILKSTRQDVHCEIIVKGKFTGTAGPSLYATINAIRIGNY